MSSLVRNFPRGFYDFKGECPLSKLLYNERPLLIPPTLATKIGLNEAIVLQQVHYWVAEINKRANRNFKDGHYWTFNSYKKWKEQFPFWSLKTIQRIFEKLEKMNLLITGNFNKLSMDRTKWYRINYQQLELLENETATNRDDHLDNLTKCDEVNLTKALPESNIPETTTENNDNGATSRSALPSQKINDVDNSNADIVQQAVSYYLSVYEKEFKEDHPKLKKAQWSRIRGVLSYFADDNMLDYEAFEAMIDRHFERSMETDYNINHFATEGVLANLFYEAAY